MAQEFDKSLLKDPAQDRFAIIGVLDGKGKVIEDSRDNPIAFAEKQVEKHPTKDVNFLRNDRRKLKSAHNNPWYVMMTVAGELDAQNSVDKNKEKMDQNRSYWHGFIGQCFRDQGWLKTAQQADGRGDWAAADFIAYYATELGVERSEFNQLTKAEEKKINTALHKRCGPDMKWPDPTKGVVLHNTLFLNPVRFGRRLFLSSASFGSSHFASDAYFRSSHFASAADFRFSHFASAAEFSSSHFASDAEFSSSRFASRAYFGSSYFAYDASFRSSYFASAAYFVSSHFASFAFFESSHFASFAFFGSSHFASVADFVSSHFTSVAHFDEGIFKAKTDFTKAVFETRVPSFHGCDLYSNTLFSARERYRHLWPPAKSGQSPEEQKSNFAEIRDFVAGKRRVEEEQFFHRREIEVQQVDANLSTKAFYGFYGLLSNYGHSIGRPIFGLFVLWAIVWFCLMMHDPQRWSVSRDWEFLGKNAGLSASNLFSYLGITRLHYGDFISSEKITDAMKTALAFQTFFAVILQFLLGLGLRSRFRLR